MKRVITLGMRFAAPALVAVGILFVVSGCGRSVSPPPEQILADIQYLADDAREGRGLGTAGLDTAARAT